MALWVARGALSSTIPSAHSRLMALPVRKLGFGVFNVNMKVGNIPDDAIRH